MVKHFYFPTTKSLKHIYETFAFSHSSTLFCGMNHILATGKVYEKQYLVTFWTFLMASSSYNHANFSSSNNGMLSLNKKVENSSNRQLPRNLQNVAAGCCCCCVCPNTDVAPPPKMPPAADVWLEAAPPNRPPEAGWAPNVDVLPKPPLPEAIKWTTLKT